MFLRYTSAILFGSLIASGLLLLMQGMIATGRPVLSPDVERPVFDFVRVERAVVVEPDRPKPEKTPAPETRPEPARLQSIDEFGTSLAVAVTSPSTTPRSRVGLGGFGLSDGEYLPVVKVAPNYPVRAIERRLEGYVIVAFTVTQSGSTRDVRIVESTNGIFEQAAIDSAEKYRYRPRVINGEPVEVHDVQTLIRFVLED